MDLEYVFPFPHHISPSPPPISLSEFLNCKCPISVLYILTLMWYPGGVEGVLVVWQLDTGKKKFLPRIGSPLLYLTDSLDPSLSSVRRFSINIFVHSLW